MSFCIQAGNPKVQPVMDDTDQTLADVVESMFLLNTENAILMWNYICIPLSYKYDISYMLDDIMIMLNKLQNKKTGELTIHWLPDTFRCDWRIKWDLEKLEIEAQWENTVGPLENLLKENPNISLLKDDFIKEWKSILQIIIKGLYDCGFDKIKIKGMKQLMKIYENIKGNGILYEM